MGIGNERFGDVKMTLIAQGPVAVPLNHISFHVADIEEAVDTWATKMNAGPFFLLERIKFDYVDAGSESAVFEHSTAFGQWGDIVVELQQLHEVAPTWLRSKFEVPMNHVAYVVPDGEATSRDLEVRGLPLFLTCGFGPITARFHSIPGMAHSIEIHQASDFLDAFFEGLRNSASGWRGERPLRIGPPQDQPS